MRQVAGRLRLDLAQYNELAAFAQFGSELDKASQNQLARGERLVELLKQDQYKPMPVEDQVAVLFAGINGYIDDLPVPSVKRFESEFLTWMKATRAEVLKDIRSKGQIDDDLKAKLTDAIQTFKGSFKP
jgi:F-type H+-transporting ATPase subunit alpha